MKRRTCFVIFVAVALVVCAAIAIIGYILVERERGAVEDAYGKEIAEMCNPPAGGSPDLANMPETAGPYKALVLEAGDTMRYEWHDDLDSDFRAKDRESVGLVVCVTERDEVIESCDYTPEDSEDDKDVAFTIDRVQKYTDLVVLNPANGLRVAELSARGAEPKACPDTARSSSNKVKYNGDDVSFNDFWIVIEPYLNGSVQ